MAWKECYKLYKNREKRQDYDSGQQNSNTLTEILLQTTKAVYHNLMPNIKNGKVKTHSLENCVNVYSEVGEKEYTVSLLNTSNSSENTKTLHTSLLPS